MISPSLGADLAQPVADVYQAAELRLLAHITQQLQQGIDGKGWEVEQLARLQQLTKWATAELGKTNASAARLIQATLASAYQQGNASALADVGDALPARKTTGVQRIRAVSALANDLATALSGGQATILRSTRDIYQAIIADAAQGFAAGGESRRDATARAIRTFLAKGLPAIKTKRGQMDIATYANMAMRTATARAALQGATDTADALDLDLVLIHPGPRACSICDKWAGKVLARKGTAGKVTVRNELTGGTIEVDVYATLSDARADGWGHPNCRCSLEIYIPGVTDLAAAQQRPKFDADAYKAQQQQRGIERQIRAWKVRQAIATDPVEAAKAGRQVSRWQAAMRDHLEAHDYLKRQSANEQITGTLSGNPDAARFAPKPRAGTTAASSTPKLDKLAKLTEKTGDFRTRSRGANPGFATGGKPYTNNCTHVVVAMEMRARGYSVKATPIPGGRGQPAHVSLVKSFRNSDGSDISLVEMLPTGKAEAIDKIMSWPVGARGIMSLGWKGTRSGHIFNVERTGDGWRIVEGQTNDGHLYRDGQYVENASRDTFQVLRLDDKVMTDDALEYAAPVDPGAAVPSASAMERAAAEAKAKAIRSRLASIPEERSHWQERLDAPDVTEFMRKLLTDQLAAYDREESQLREQLADIERNHP